MRDRSRPARAVRQPARGAGAAGPPAVQRAPAARRLAALKTQPALPPELRRSPSASRTVFTEALRDTPLPLDTIAGRYRLGDIIGVGGMGLVVSATDLASDRPVAINSCCPTPASKPTCSRNSSARPAC
ncbi:hypothetical protein [Nannocystis pusilla]|uniref:hypothetical protein n=1 Tax=Nannocystis pusilla TaxID=889268 RepID=UPI003B76DD1E